MKEGIYEELVTELVSRQMEDVDRSSFHGLSLEIMYFAA
jgi:hypothetical protein